MVVLPFITNMHSLETKCVVFILFTAKEHFYCLLSLSFFLVLFRVFGISIVYCIFDLYSFKLNKVIWSSSSLITIILIINLVKVG